MNHNVHRHLSMPCLVMRGCLRLMLEGSGEFEVVGHSRDGERRWWSGLCRTDCFGDSQRVRTAAKQLHSKLGDDADHHAYFLIQPSIGYRVEKGEKRERGTS